MIRLDHVRDLLLPAVWMMSGRAGRDVREVDLSVDHVEDAIDIHVRHRLFTRKDIEDNTYKRDLPDRLKRVLLVETPTAKDLRVERRRLKWRGETAQKHKPKKIVRKARA